MRLQIQLDNNEERILDWLKRVTGSRTHKDLFDNGMTLLQWAVQQSMQQRVVASFDPESKTYRELQMPALAKAAAIGRDPREEVAVGFSNKKMTSTAEPSELKAR